MTCRYAVMLRYFLVMNTKVSKNRKMSKSLSKGADYYPSFLNLCMPALTQAKEIKSEVWIAVTCAAPEPCIRSPSGGHYCFSYRTNTEQGEQPLCQNVCVLGSRLKGSKMWMQDIGVVEGSHAMVLVAHQQQTLSKPLVHTTAKEAIKGLHSSCCFPRARHGGLNQDCARSPC